MNARRPTNGSVAILNTNAQKGSLTLNFLTSVSPVLGFVPSTWPLSSGDGRYLITASKRNCTPLFLNDEPQVTGTIAISIVAFLMAAIISSGVIESGSSKNFSISASSYSAAASISLPLHSSHSATIFSGMSLTS